MKNTKIQFKKGFTLVETLVATIVLAISVTALMNVVAQGVFTSGYVKNKAIAISLAQEGVELVRNMQDSTLLGGNFATFEVFAYSAFQDCYFGEGVCYIDATDDILEAQTCPNGVCPPLQISQNGYFNYSSGDNTNPLNERFTRFISIVQNPATGVPSGHVTVRVEWLQGNALRNVTYETDVFLWIN